MPAGAKNPEILVSHEGSSTPSAGYQHPRALVAVHSLLNTVGAAIGLSKLR